MPFRMPKIVAKTVLWVGLSLALVSCTSTKLSSRWSDNQYQDGPLRSILVIGLFDSDVNRRVLEEGLIDRLAKNGVTAIPSFRLVPDLGETDEEQELKQLVADSGAEAVLIARLKGIDKEETVVPPRVDWVPSVGYGYYGYFQTAYHAVYQPGYTRVDTIVRLESKLFSTPNDRLIWAGDTDSFNPESAAVVVREVADTIVSDMEESGLVGRRLQ